MQPDIRWLDDPRVFNVGQMEPHSDHKVFESESDAREGRETLVQTLDGVWKFAFSINAKSRPASFYRDGYDFSAWNEIEVPGHIEIAGYDTIHYINTMYPWEGKIFRRPAFCGMKGAELPGEFSDAEYNPVGSYMCRFDLDENLRGKRVSIRFEGVEQAMFLWLNGHFLGYAEDSFSVSEFDLTEYIRNEGNVLCVEVHKRSTAAYLEDQDFFRFFGIFRSVTLRARPAMHVDDLWIRQDLNVATCMATLKLDLKTSATMEGGSVFVRVKDGDKVLSENGQPMAADVHEELHIPEPVELWEHHTPKLYQLEIMLYDVDGRLVEFVPYDVGFRKIEIIRKVMYLNGKRLILNGVNRHEWNMHSGRCITDEDERWDMECLKRNHMNAVRTCHYPDRLTWYSMCDREGIYMMAETNLESHGSWQKMQGVEPSWNVPGSIPEWEACVLDRAKKNFEVFKNHPAILFWSLGNESYAGEALAKMNAYYKEKDPDRLTHYENVCRNRVYEDRISDVESMMYAPPWEERAYLENKPKKPYILCEYMHDMGNSLGGLKSYYDIVDTYPGAQGGFIWDFIDQAIAVKDEATGREVLRYGGDFDDRPSDYEFAGNGLVFADRTEKPAMQEVKYYYELHD